MSDEVEKEEVVIEEPAVEELKPEEPAPERDVVAELVEEFALNGVDVSDIEAKVLSTQQVAELTRKVKADISTAKKVGDVLAILKTVGDMAIKMGALSVL